MRIMKEYGYMYALRLIKADYHRYSSLNKMGGAGKVKSFFENIVA